MAKRKLKNIDHATHILVKGVPILIQVVIDVQAISDLIEARGLQTVIPTTVLLNGDFVNLTIQEDS